MTAITQAEAVDQGFARYRSALRAPGALAFAIPGVIGRMPMGMLSLAQVMLVVAVTGRYAIAGVVSAGGAVLFAIVTPHAGRLADRYGQARLLRPLALIFATSTAAFAVCAMDRAPVWTLFVAGCLSRGSMPSLSSMVRSRWSHLLEGSDLLEAAFSLEGIADELIYIAGPVIVIALATGLQPVAGVLATAALSIVGVAGLTRQRRSEPPTASPVRASGGVLRSHGLRVLIAMLFCLGALFVAVDLATVAFAQRHSAMALAGPLLGLYGLGSAIAGVWYGTRRWRAAPRSRLLVALAGTAFGTLPLGFVPGVGSMAVAIVVAGLGISATLIGAYSIAEKVVPGAQRTEGMSWLTTAASAGAALGAPLAGRLIDWHGATAGFLFAFTAGLIAVLIAIFYFRDLAESVNIGSQPTEEPS